MNLLTALRLSALAALLFLSAPTASAQAFAGCGTVVQGVTCPKLFAPDAGGLYVVGGLTPFNVGDHVHVTGTIDPSCITICQQGNGCINGAVVTNCSTGTPFCFGDGSSGPCPCNNNGPTGAGCMNSVGLAAVLSASGSTSPDTVVLTSSGELPTALSIFLQGDANLGVPVPFGDGLRCVGGTLRRLAVKNASGGSVSFPGPGDPSVTQQSANLGDPLSPGTTRWYQTYYRDPNIAFCPQPAGNNWNVSSGLEITW